MKRFDTVARELNSLSGKLKSLRTNANEFVGNITFSVEEQELIRRVFKSIFPQVKGSRDKETAKNILRKTGWINGT